MTIQNQPSIIAPLPSRTRRNVIFVTGIRVALQAVWFIATLMLARALGLVIFGLYGACANAIRLVVGCFGDALDLAVMREAPLYIHSDRPRALELIRSAFWLRVAVGVGSIAVTAAMPWLVARLIFGSAGADYRHLALLAAAGVLGDLLLRSALGYFQVNLQFDAFLVTDAIWQLGRVLLVIALIHFTMLGATTAVVMYVGVPYLAFIAATLVIPSDMLRLAPPSRRQLTEIIRYSKWMFIALMLASLYERIDFFMVEWFGGHAAAGTYAAALTLAAIPDFIDGAVQTVLSPKVVPAYAAGRFGALQRRYLMYSIPFGIIAAVVARGWGGPIIRACLSEHFAGSIDVFRVLVLGTLFNLVFTPMPAALLNFLAPRVAVWINLLGLLIVLAGGLAVIPSYGPLGAAEVVVTARVVLGILTLILIRTPVIASGNKS